MKTRHLPIVMAIAALAPSACTSSFPAGIDYGASGGSGALGVDSGAGGVADAASVATGGAVATGGMAGRGTGGVAGAEAGGAPAMGGIAGTGGVAGAEAGGAPAFGGTAIVGAGGVAGTVGLDASAGGVAGTVGLDASAGGAAGCVPAGTTSPMAMLPSSNEIGNWALLAAPVSIDKELDLYAWIDGAAPKYIDRGWLRSAYATYQQRSGSSTVQVAIHDVGTAWNADTLFKTYLPPSRIELGTNAVVDMGVSASYAAQGWTGQFYVEVSLDDHSDAALVYVRAFVLQILNRVCTVGADAGSTPDAPAAAPAYRSVTAGCDEACALRTDGSVACWGESFSGEGAPCVPSWR